MISVTFLALSVQGLKLQVDQSESNPTSGFHCSPNRAWHNEYNLAAGNSQAECNTLKAQLEAAIATQQGGTVYQLGSCMDPNGHAGYGGVAMIGAWSGVTGGCWTGATVMTTFVAHAGGSGGWGCTAHKAAYKPSDGTKESCDALAASLNAGLGLGGSAKGDPHLRNINGNKFNVVRQGDAPLLKITSDSDGAAQLKIMGRITGASRCAKETMITALNISGSWLEKTIVVSVGDKTETLRVSVDDQNVWSAGPNAPEYKDRMDFNAARAKDKYKRNFVYNHEAGKFSVEELDTSKTAKSDPGIEIQMSYDRDVSIKITRPMRLATTIPHLNLDVQGLKVISRSFKVGGLLGMDDHSSWTKRPSECKAQFAVMPTEFAGSRASASY